MGEGKAYPFKKIVIVGSLKANGKERNHMRFLKAAPTSPSEKMRFKKV